MFLKKSIIFVAIAAQLCSSLELELIAKYEGKHSYKCGRQQRLTGALVKDKIFTFGGCFPVPYMVDPENDVNEFGFDFDKRFNTTDTVYSYDILQDSWALETHSPLPINEARLQVVNNDVYLYDVYAQPDRNRSLIWKYETDTKQWHTLGELPFVWRFRLTSCEHDGIIYFAGNHDGSLRNIVQRYDISKNEWKKPLFLDEQIEINKMICAKDSIQFVGRKAHRDLDEGWVYVDMDTPRKMDYSFYSSSYEDGKTLDSGFNISLTFDARATPSGDWLYVLDTEKKNSTLKKVNILSKEVVELGTFEQALKNALFVPYHDEVAYLIGGSNDNFMFSNRKPTDKDELKTYNHKVKFIQDTLVTDEQQIVIQDH